LSLLDLFGLMDLFGLLDLFHPWDLFGPLGLFDPLDLYNLVHQLDPLFLGHLSGLAHRSVLEYPVHLYNQSDLALL
jgi:hypothetical protein